MSQTIQLITAAPAITEPLAVKDSGDIARFNEASARNLKDIRDLSAWLNSDFIPRTNELIEPLSSVFPNLVNIARTAASADNIDLVVPHAGNVDTVAPHVTQIDTVALQIAAIVSVYQSIVAVNTAADNLAAIIAAPTHAQTATDAAAAALASQTAAASSEDAAGASEDAARTSELSAAASRDAAALSQGAAKESEDEARRLAGVVAGTVDLPLINAGDRGKAIVVNGGEMGWELRVPLEVVTPSGITPATHGYTIPTGTADQVVVIEGMGMYRWSATATDRADGESVLLPSAGTETTPGRWLLLLPSAELIASDLGAAVADLGVYARKTDADFIAFSESTKRVLAGLESDVQVLDSRILFMSYSASIGSVSASSAKSVNVAFQGVVVGDVVAVTPNIAMPGIVFTASVDSDGVVLLTATNAAAAAITLSARTFVFTAFCAGKTLG